MEGCGEQHMNGESGEALHRPMVRMVLDQVCEEDQEKEEGKRRRETGKRA